MYYNNNRMTVEGEERGFSGRKWGTDSLPCLAFLEPEEGRLDAGLGF
jgi:hypothetical protein